MTALRFSEFADRFPAEMKEKVEKLAADVVTSAADKLDSLIQEPTSTGTLRSSRTRQTVNGGIRFAWTAQRAIGIDPGRIMSKTMTRITKSGAKSKPFSRMLGSPDRPEGFTRPAIEGLRGVWDETVSNAGKEF